MALLDFTNRTEKGTRLTIAEMDAILETIKSAVNGKEIFTFPKHSTLSAADAGKMLMLIEEGGIMKAKVYTLKPAEAGTPGEWSITINELSHGSQLYGSCKVTVLQQPRAGVDYINITDNQLGNFAHGWNFVNTVVNPESEILIGADEAETAENIYETINLWLTDNQYYNLILAQAAVANVVEFRNGGVYSSLSHLVQFIKINVSDTDYLGQDNGGYLLGYEPTVSVISVQIGEANTTFGRGVFNTGGAPNGATPADTTEEAENLAWYLDGLSQLDDYTVTSSGNVVTIERNAATDDGEDENNMISFIDWDCSFQTVVAPEDNIPESSQYFFLGVLESVEGSNAIIRRGVTESFVLDTGSSTDMSDIESVLLAPAGNGKVKNLNGQYDIPGLVGVALENKSAGETVKLLTNVPFQFLILGLGES